MGGSADQGGRPHLPAVLRILRGDQLPRLEANVRAVPEGRLLLESDLDVPDRIDPAMHAICTVVAKVKGWTFERTAEVTAGNARSFLAIVPTCPAQAPAAEAPQTTVALAPLAAGPLGNGVAASLRPALVSAAVVVGPESPAPGRAEEEL